MNCVTESQAITADVFESLLMVVPAADLTLRSFFGVTLHTLTVESAKPPAIKLESSVTSTPVRPCSSPGVNLFHFLNAVFRCSAGMGIIQRFCTENWILVEATLTGETGLLSDM